MAKGRFAREGLLDLKAEAMALELPRSDGARSMRLALSTGR